MLSGNRQEKETINKERGIRETKDEIDKNEQRRRERERETRTVMREAAASRWGNVTSGVSTAGVVSPNTLNVPDTVYSTAQHSTVQSVKMTYSAVWCGVVW